MWLGYKESIKIFNKKIKKTKLEQDLNNLISQLNAI